MNFCSIQNALNLKTTKSQTMDNDRFETLFKLMDAATRASDEMLRSTTNESFEKFMAMNKALQNECQNQLNKLNNDKGQ